MQTLDESPAIELVEVSECAQTQDSRVAILVEE